MKRLSEIKGEAALDVLADLIEPASEIMADDDIKDAVREDKRAEAVALALRNHKRAVITVMAVLEEEDPDKYEPPLLKLPAMLLQLFNDPELVQVFYLQGQTQEENASGSATPNTKGTGKK